MNDEYMDLMYKTFINKIVVRLYGGPASLTFRPHHAEHEVYIDRTHATLCYGTPQQCFYAVRGWYECAALVLEKEMTNHG